jgi:D-alanyl-lipoteichoic acid acyltransferase DltB (MBOAT superfamily)
MPLLVRIRDLGKAGVIVTLMVTFAVVGIWHGATWPFLLFGRCQGAALCVEFVTKHWRTRRLKSLPAKAVAWAGRFYTMGFFVLSQVLFRSPTLHQALWVYGRLFRLRGPGNLFHVFASKPFFLALDCLAIGVWIGLAGLQHRTTARGTPWYALLCGLCVLFLGHLGAAHFIYAAF